MLYVVNFADEKYRDKQILNTKSAYEKGKADKVFEYSPKDLTELKLKFPAHFNVKRGYGLWFWKPYVILTYIIHSGFISGYQNRYGDNLKPPTNVYHRMTA